MQALEADKNAQAGLDTPLVANSTKGVSLHDSASVLSGADATITTSTTGSLTNLTKAQVQALPEHRH